MESLRQISSFPHSKKYSYYFLEKRTNLFTRENDLKIKEIKIAFDRIMEWQMENEIVMGYE